MSESIDTEILAASTDAMPRLGEVLREKREELGLTIEDVSNRLRLSVRQIKALENNDFGAFSESMMTRGFIRNYARLLEIDAEPLLAVFRTHVPNDAPHALSIQSANVLLPSHQRRSRGKYLIALLIIVFVAGAWVFYSEFLVDKDAVKSTAKATSENTVAESIEPGEASDSKSVTTTEPMPEPALPLAERIESATEQAVTPTGIVPNAGSTTSTAAIAPVEQTKQVEPTKQAQADATKPAVPIKPFTGPSLKVKFTFSEQSWISVVDRNGNEIFNKTKSAGSADEVEGQPPLKVIVGNAGGTQVIYKDKPIDLAPYSRLNVARLNLSLE